jgi:hypothetical protein
MVLLAANRDLGFGLSLRNFPSQSSLIRQKSIHAVVKQIAFLPEEQGRTIIECNSELGRGK